MATAAATNRAQPPFVDVDVAVAVGRDSFIRTADARDPTSPRDRTEQKSSAD
jgi:hypothetical protein